VVESYHIVLHYFFDCVNYFRYYLLKFSVIDYVKCLRRR